MAHGDPTPFPRAVAAVRDGVQPLERTVAEIEAAVELVRSGRAVRILISGPAVEPDVAMLGAARAGAAGVRFRVESTADRSARITIGPVLD